MRCSGEGPTPALWFLCGEGPGQQEDRAGLPFQGKTGEELRRYFDGDVLPHFADTFRSNIYREWGGKDYEYTQADFERDEPELLDELRECQPQIIVAIGRHAARYFLGNVSMDEVHGLPWYLPEASRAYSVLCASQRKTVHDVRNAGDAALSRSRWGTGATVRARSGSGRRDRDADVDRHAMGGQAVVVFPCYHPAAGFRSPELSALVAYDFAQLAMFVKGEVKARRLYDDPHPDPTYQHVSSDDDRGAVAVLRTLPPGVDELGFDSEGYARKPWSVQWSHIPGTGYLARANDPATVDVLLREVLRRNIRLTYHNALHDRGVLRAVARQCGWSEHDILFGIDQIPFEDTMVMAYLLQLEPQGLKGLATRHANMAMQSYDEILGDAQNRLALDHLQAMWDCLNFDYEEEQQREFERINRTPLLDKQGRPKRDKSGHIKYRKTRVLPKLPKSRLFKAVERCMRAKTPFKNWTNQDEDIRAEGYVLLGDMPEASLSHVEFAKALHYGCRDADATVRVKPEMATRLQALGLHDVYRLELSTYPLIDRMMQIGMKPDLKVFKALSNRLAIEIADLQVAIETAVGKEGFNANSGDQVAAYLFDTLGLDPIKMTTAGDRASTNDKILETLEKEHGHEYPVISDIRSYRETYKLKYTFVDRVPDFVHRWPFDGRVHATFRTTRVITGRLAASDPNILAQPEHGEFAKDFKAGWVAEEGHVVCNWDQSQVELRGLAHLTQDPVLLEAYRYECPHKKAWEPGKTICDKDPCVLKGDLHSRLAHRMFGKMPSQQDKSKHRLPSKAVNFGIPMGMTCYGLAVELRKNGVQTDEEGAQEWLDATNALYKRVPIFKAEKIAEARRLGYIRCLSGRVRYIGGIRSKDERLRSEAERFAFSTPVQESAQWVMKQAEAFIWSNILMPYYREGWYKGGPKGQWIEPLVQIHDAIRMECAIPMARDLHVKITHALTKVPIQLSVPLVAEGEYGPDFAHMRPF